MSQNKKKSIPNLAYKCSVIFALTAGSLQTHASIFDEIKALISGGKKAATQTTITAEKKLAVEVAKAIETKTLNGELLEDSAILIGDKQLSVTSSMPDVFGLVDVNNGNKKVYAKSFNLGAKLALKRTHLLYSRFEDIANMSSALRNPTKKIIFFNGPVGSGKTSTLESMITLRGKSAVTTGLEKLQFIQLDSTDLMENGRPSKAFTTLINSLESQKNSRKNDDVVFVISNVEKWISMAGAEATDPAVTARREFAKYIERLSESGINHVIIESESTSVQKIIADVIDDRQFSAVYHRNATVDEAVEIVKVRSIEIEHRVISLDDEVLKAAARIASSEIKMGNPQATLELLEAAQRKVIDLLVEKDQNQIIRTLERNRDEALFELQKINGKKSTELTYEDTVKMDIFRQTLSDSKAKLAQARVQQNTYAQELEQLSQFVRLTTEKRRALSSIEYSAKTKDKYLALTYEIKKLDSEMMNLYYSLSSKASSLVPTIGDEKSVLIDALDSFRSSADKLTDKQKTELFKKYFGVRDLKSATDELLQSVVGQDDNLKYFMNNITPLITGKQSHPPILTFFTGVSRTGKTFSAEQLAKVLGKCLVILTGSEFSKATAINNALGSDRGYVGYGKPGMLAEAIQRCPNGVVFVCDEYDQWAPEARNIIYNATDVTNPVVSDSVLGKVRTDNCIFIMTSNLFEKIDDDYVKQLAEPQQAEYIKIVMMSMDPKGRFSKVDISNAIKKLMPYLKTRDGKPIFTEAVANRLASGALRFGSFDEDGLQKLMAKSVKKMQEQLLADQGIELELSKATQSFLSVVASFVKPGTISDTQIRETVSNFRSIIGQMLDQQVVKQGDKIFVNLPLQVPVGRVPGKSEEVLRRLLDAHRSTDGDGEFQFGKFASAFTYLKIFVAPLDKTEIAKIRKATTPQFALQTIKLGDPMVKAKSIIAVGGKFKGSTAKVVLPAKREFDPGMRNSAIRRHFGLN